MKTIIYFLGLLILNLKAQIVVGTDAIYGTDDRQVVSKNSPSLIKELSKSIGLVVDNSLIERQNFAFSTLDKTSNVGDVYPSLNICSNEKFSILKSAEGACTGFLISPDTFVSAGHCFVNAADCSSKSIIFDDYEANTKNDKTYAFNKNIFKCKSVISSVTEYDHFIDYSIIKIENTQRMPLKISKKFLDAKTKVFMIGHPLGYGLIYSRPSIITENIKGNPYFKTTLDSFKGNSGSPVFDSRTNEVVGMMVFGMDDFVFDENRSCNKLAIYDPNKLIDKSKSETVTRITNVK